ncbi:MAG TPA: 30S ribosomal protein S20 [Microthrixaceae bacterium]|nr:30S ribosomal protein S20 [Microthrixaceae bacterium]
MANIKSQIKRNKQNEKARLRNKAVRSELRTRVKTAETAATRATGDEGQETAEAAARAAASKIDRAASKGVIHKNAASRKKSRLAKRLTKLSADASAN